MKEDESCSSVAEEMIVWHCKACGLTGKVAIKGNDDVAIALHKIEKEHRELSPMCMNPVRRIK